MDKSCEMPSMSMSANVIQDAMNLYYYKLPFLSKGFLNRPQILGKIDSDFSFVSISSTSQSATNRHSFMGCVRLQPPMTLGQRRFQKPTGSQ